MMEYNPETCITAGELRDMGIDIPDSTPDCAWVLRSSIVPVGFGVSDPETDDGKLTGTIYYQFTKPFNWVQLDITWNIH